jgi:prevent-host-death family protein
MKQVSVTEFKAKCLALIEEVDRTGESIEVLKRGRAVARVVRAPQTRAKYPQETLKGTVEILGDIVGPAVEPDEWEAERD